MPWRSDDRCHQAEHAVRLALRRSEQSERPWTLHHTRHLFIRQQTAVIIVDPALTCAACSTIVGPGRTQLASTQLAQGRG